MSKYQNQKEKGFTLIELLIVIGILAVLLAITIIAINPARQFAKANNAGKYNAANALLNAISQCYAESRGQFSGACASVGTITTGTAYQVCRGTGASGCGSSAAAATGVDLCALVNTSGQSYIAELPKDPQLATSASGGYNFGLPGICATSGGGSGQDYNTKLTITRSAEGKITVSATPDTNDPSVTTISVSR